MTQSQTRASHWVDQSQRRAITSGETQSQERADYAGYMELSFGKDSFEGEEEVGGATG